MKYAYLTKAGILHVVSSIEGAKENSASGKIVETEIEAHGGYPVHNGEEIIAYSAEEMKIDAKGDCIDPIPEIAALYKECE